MLDIGWQELLVIGALALIVVGPKDLPSLLRSVGQWVGKVRGMARDFQRAMTDAARDTEMSAFKDLQDIRKINPLDDFKKQAQNAQSFLNGSGDTPEKKETSVTAATPEPAEEPDPGMVDTSSAEAPAPAAEPAPAPAPATDESTSKAATP
ncbi:MAG: Sec-independent protein translocase protein TatB [Pseudomonadota bacterium]